MGNTEVKNAIVEYISAVKEERRMRIQAACRVRDAKDGLLKAMYPKDVDEDDLPDVDENVVVEVHGALYAFTFDVDDMESHDFFMVQDLRGE